MIHKQQELRKKGRALFAGQQKNDRADTFSSLPQCARFSSSSTYCVRDVALFMLHYLPVLLLIKEFVDLYVLFTSLTDNNICFNCGLIGSNQMKTYVFSFTLEQCACGKENLHKQHIWLIHFVY